MKVVVYSHDADTRARIRLAIGRRPAPDVPEAEIIEVATQPALFRLLDAGGADVMVLDGEAQPSGGMGVCRQAKDEIYNCPPVLLIIGRADDGWLATWSRADAVVSHPIDPVALAQALAGLMRQRAAAAAEAELFSRTAGFTPRRRSLALHPGPPGSRHGRPHHLARAARRADQRRVAHRRGERLGDERDHGGRGHAGPDRRVRRRAADQGRPRGEVAGLARAMLAHATPISVPGRLTDLVGTGGDGARTVNISTMGTIVAAAAGARMVKHGNRAASSACGAADVLEALGVVIDLPPAATDELVAEVGIVFLFAPLYHPALRHTRARARELGVPTVFNFLGPVANPARPAAQAVGVADPRMGPVLAGVLAGRGCSALVFHGDDGLDELTTTGPSTVWVVHDGAGGPDRFDPAELGIPRRQPADLRGGDAAHNAAVVRAVLAGERGPVRDTVLLNAAAALAADGGRGRPGGGRPGAGRRLRAGRRAVDSGAAAALLDRWIEASRRLAPRAAASLARPRSAQASAPSRSRTRPPGHAGNRCGTRCGSRCA